MRESDTGVWATGLDCHPRNPWVPTAGFNLVLPTAPVRNASALPDDGFGAARATGSGPVPTGDLPGVQAYNKPWRD